MPKASWVKLRDPFQRVIAAGVAIAGEIAHGTEHAEDGGSRRRLQSFTKVAEKSHRSGPKQLVESAKVVRLGCHIPPGTIGISLCIIVLIVPHFNFFQLSTTRFLTKGTLAFRLKPESTSHAQGSQGPGKAEKSAFFFEHPTETGRRGKTPVAAATSKRPRQADWESTETAETMRTRAAGSSHETCCCMGNFANLRTSNRFLTPRTARELHSTSTPTVLQ